MTPPNSINKPVIFLGHEDYIRLSEAYRTQGGNPEEDVFEARNFPLGNWLRLLSSAPYRISGLIRDPLNPAVLENIFKTHQELSTQEPDSQGQLSLLVQSDPLAEALMKDDVVSVDGVPFNTIRAFISKLHQLPPIFFQSIYNPTTNDWRADVRRLMGYNLSPEDVASRIVQSGTWALSAIKGFHPAIEEALQHPRLPEWIEHGARVMVVAGKNGMLARPVLIPLQISEDGKLIFWKPRDSGAPPQGSPAAYIHTDSLIERFHLNQIRTRFNRAVEIARRAGKKPMIVFDIDGTVANARAFTGLIFEEFLDLYERLSIQKLEGLETLFEQAADISHDDIQTALSEMGVTDREIIGLAQGHWDFRKRESLDKTYDSALAISELIKAYGSIDQETAKELRNAYEAYRQDHDDFAWNNVEMLKLLGITDPNVHLLAAAHFERNFFSSVRRIDKQPIEGTVQLIRLLQSRYPDLATVSVTLRDAHDDNLPDGRSSSKVWFQKVGIWNDQSVLLRLEERSFINFSADAFRAGSNEPNKGDLLRKYLDEHPEIHPIMILENDPRHSNNYQQLFPHEVIVVRVDARDTPPYSPPDSKGVFIFNAAQLKNALDENLGPDATSELNDKAIRIDEEAWQPMMIRWDAAVSAGIQPVAIFDLDDTLFMTSNRTRHIIEKFLTEEWIPNHPEHAWATEVIEGFTLSQIEYGIPATLRAAGLEGLGPEFEQSFKNYFLRHFLSNEYLDRDLPRIGAINLVKRLHSIGTRIVYLTGRTRDDMGEGTIAAIKLAGLPLDENTATLVMREDHNEPDSVFKARTLPIVVGNGALIAFFDNEPQNLIDAQNIFPDSLLYLVGTKHSPEAPTPPIVAINITDFAGEIGPPPARTRPIIGDKLRAHGEKIADKLISTLSSLHSDHLFMYGHGSDHKDRIKASMRPNQQQAQSLLSNITSLHQSHPINSAFISKINELISRLNGGIAHFEDLMHLVNHPTGRAFTTIIGQGGVAQIIDAANGIPEDYEPQPLPAAFKSEPISLEDALPLFDLEQKIMDLDPGPPLTDTQHSNLIDVLAFDSYPRLEEVLKSIVAELVKRSYVQPYGIRAIEYGPRRAIAAMTILRRMGVNVGWRELVLPHKLHTEMELLRLPQELRSDINFIPQDEPATADIAIWNLPTSKTTFDQMTMDITRPQDENVDRLLIIQSEQSLVDKIARTANQSGFRPVINVRLQNGRYVMPSAFLHVARGATRSALAFQVFRFTSRPLGTTL